MIKYRVKFTKEGDARYISQLDLVRLFTRTFKRAGLTVSYSQGFNPHPKMSVGMPLGIGVTSECEFLDFELDAPVDLKEILKGLNSVTAPCIRFTAAELTAERTPKLRDAKSATYIVKIEGTLPDAEKLGTFLSREDICVMKKTKSGAKMTDIKPDIFNITPVEPDTLIMELAAGSAAYC